MVAKKVLITCIFLILMVEVIIGEVAVAIKSNVKTRKNGPFYEQTKLVTKICNYTDYHTKCKESLSLVAQNSSAGFKDYMKAALLSISHQAQTTLNMTNSLMVGLKTGTRVEKSVKECNDLMKQASDEVHAMVSYIDNVELRTMNDRALELQIRIGSVNSFAGTCMDVIGDDNRKVIKAMKGHIKNVTATADNALAIMGEISNILGMFDDVKLNQNIAFGAKGSNNRRLMMADDTRAVPIQNEA